MPTALPPSSDITGSSRDEGQAKAWLTAIRDFLSGLLGADGTQNAALAALGVPFSNGVLSKTAAYTVAAADRGAVIDCSGTWTLGLLPAATAGDKFLVTVRNSGSGVITIDPNLSETVDGAATLSLAAGESVTLLVDGTAWITIGRAGGVPSGALMSFAGSTTPAGWLLCDGSAVSRTTYASLFTAVGTTYGVGDGSSTFNLPDLRGRVPVGKDNMGGSAANRVTTAGSGVDGATLGANGGAQTHTLTTAQLPAHTHALLTDTLTGGTNATLGKLSGGTPGATGSTGSGDAHNNMQPSLVANYLIKT